MNKKNNLPLTVFFSPNNSTNCARRPVSYNFITFGIVVFNMFNIVVIVSTEVIPSAIRAAVESGGMQNDIHDKMTISAQGA